MRYLIAIGFGFALLAISFFALAVAFGDRPVWADVFLLTMAVAAIIGVANLGVAVWLQVDYQATTSRRSPEEETTHRLTDIETSLKLLQSQLDRRFDGIQVSVGLVLERLGRLSTGRLTDELEKRLTALERQHNELLEEARRRLPPPPINSSTQQPRRPGVGPT